MSLLHVDSVILWSKDMEKTVSFYKKLGLPIISEDHGDGHPHYALDFGDVHFGFLEGTPDSGLKRGEGGAVQFGFRVKDVDHTYKLALSIGAKGVIDPQDMPWGRRAVVEDPDGRPLQFKQV